MTAAISKASFTDRERLADIFISHIDNHREYISHGEVQMGVGYVRTGKDGLTEVIPTENGREMWLKYIDEKLSSPEAAIVLKATIGTEIAGFCVADIEEDGADPFGMVCDILVLDSHRGKGIGSALLNQALDWLRSKNVNGIYLESGKDNHAAHEFFRHKGFSKVSEIFKLGI